MNRPKKSMLGTGLVVGVLTVISSAFAAGKGPMSEPAPEGIHGFFQSLSADQQAAIGKLMLEHEKKIIALRAEIETKQLELYSLITEEASETKIDAKIEEIGKIRTGLEKQHVSLGLKIRKLLTAEQKAKFDALHLMRSMGGGGFRPMGPGGFPPEGMHPGPGGGPVPMGGGPR
jgi:Spy/CpxP family protein refolding chaperone